MSPGKGKNPSFTEFKTNSIENIDAIDEADLLNKALNIQLEVK